MAHAWRSLSPVDDRDLAGHAADRGAGTGRNGERHLRGPHRERTRRLVDRGLRQVVAGRTAARDRQRRRRSAPGDRTRVLRAWAVGGITAATVDAIDRLAEDVRVRFIERAWLPLVDQVVGVLRVRVTPLVAGHVVGGDPGAKGDERPVPGRVRAAVAPVENGVHDGAGAVEGVAPEGMLIEVVCLLGSQDHVVGFARRGRECLSLPPNTGSRGSWEAPH